MKKNNKITMLRECNTPFLNVGILKIFKNHNYSEIVVHVITKLLA